MPMSAFATDDDEIPVIGEWEDGELEEEIPVVETRDEDEIRIVDETDGETEAKDITVSFEASERREANEKHFRLSDGNFAAASYNQPVHYLDHAGNWQEIDNKLVEQEGSYLAAAGAMEKEFSRVPGEDYLFRMSFENYGLQFTAIEPLGEVDKSEDGAAMTVEPVEPEEPAESEEPTESAEPTVSEELAATEEVAAPEELPAEDEAEILEEALTETADSDEPAALEEQTAEIADEISVLGTMPENETPVSPEADGEQDIIIVEINEEEPEETEAPIESDTPVKAEPIKPASDEELTDAGYQRINCEGMSLNIENSEGDMDVSGLTLEQAADLSRLCSTLCYTEILPGVSYLYRNIGYNVKESILIEEPRDQYRFSFAVQTQGLTVQTMEDGSLIFFDDSGKGVFTIPAPYLVDAADEYSDKAWYEISKFEGGIILTVEADSDWINDPARVFPVTLDPTSALSFYLPTDGMTANFVSSDSNTAGTHQQLYVGYVSNSSGGGTEQQVFAGFDQIPTIPTNCIVTRARLEIIQSAWSSGNSALRNFGVYEVTSALPANTTYKTWINGRTWSTRPSVSGIVLDYFSANQDTIGTHFYLDITRVAKKWYSNTGTRAICIKRMSLTEGGANAYGRAVFPGYGWNLNSELTPYLYVDYHDDVGLENYYSYQAHSIDRAGTGYIGDFTQALTLVKSDLSAASTVMPVSVSHIYNSANANNNVNAYAPSSCYGNMNAGLGWKLSFQQSVQPAQGTTYLRYMDADGTIHYFKRSDYDNTKYLDEDGLNLVLWKESTANCYTLVDLKGNRMRFDNSYLSYIEDANGNRITYVRNGSNQVTSITRKNNGLSAETIATLSYSSNYLSSITDSAGNVTSFTYSSNRLTTITQPDGKTVSYTYDSSGRLLTAKDNESSYSLTYTYNSQGRISGYTEKAGSTAGASVSVSDGEGLTLYRYCGADRVLNNSDDLITGYVFDYFGHTITSYTTDSNGTTIYNAEGGHYTDKNGTSGLNNRLQLETSVGMRPVGSPSGYEFTHKNLLTSTQQGTLTGTYSGSPNTNSGQSVSLSTSSGISSDAHNTYIFSGWAKADSVSLRSSTTRRFELYAKITYTDATTDEQTEPFCADSSQWQYAVLPVVPKYPTKTVQSITVGFRFNNNANSAQFKLPCVTMETASKYEWDSNGNLTSVVSPSQATPSYSYTGADLISQVSMGNGTFSYTYDSHHNVTGVTNAGLSMSLAYDAAGNATSSTLTGGSLHMGSTATYTNYGNLLASQTDTRGKTTSYTYGNAISKQLGQPTAVTDPKSVTVNTSYNTQNGRVTGSSMTGVSLAYTYGSGRLTAMTRTANSLGQTYNMGYNGFGQLTSVKVGTSSLASYTYGSNDGVMTKLTYGNGNTVGYGYDNLERVTNVYYNNSSSPAYTYTYYGEGTLKQLTDSVNNRTYEYDYDSLNRLNKLTEKYNGSEVQYYTATYDTANRPDEIIYRVSPQWNGTYNYQRRTKYLYRESDGAMTTMVLPGGVHGYTYDALKRVTARKLWLNENYIMTRNYGYLAGSGSNTSTLVSSLSNTKNSTTFNSYNYSYDNVGNITAITGSTAATYTYDSQNQLTKEVLNGTTYNYTYDAAGNIKTKTKSSGSGTDTFTYGNSNWRDLLTAYNGNSITYDAIGNPLTYYNGTTFTWVNGKRLATAVNTSTGLNNSYTYDANGLRLTKTVNGVQHKYIWQGGRLVAEYYPGNTFEYFYDESGMPYGCQYNGTTYYYVTNLQGDIIKIIDINGNVKAEYAYDAWGNILTATGTLAAVNPIRYRGYYYDSDTGFYYLKSRYYDPAICRFINADGLASTGQGFIGCNMFAYCLNNPVNGCDPSGNFPWYMDENGEEHEGEPNHVIKYSVPVYSQGHLSICYAFCQVMVESFISGRTLSPAAAEHSAISIAMGYNHSFNELDWNRGGLPLNTDWDNAIYGDFSISEIYSLLVNSGCPLYAFYYANYYEDGIKKTSGHGVVIIGVDCECGIVYTNNPWGVNGEQFFDEFLNGFIHSGTLQKNYELKVVAPVL